MAEYLPVLVLFAGTVAAVAVLYGVALLLAPGAAPVPGDPFLSGELPSEHALGRYHVRWYAVMLLFLAFDMEMVFMYPWAVVFADLGAVALLEMGAFLLILTLGIVYAWREGALRWT